MSSSAAVPRDFERGFLWYLTAAEQWDESARDTLGVEYPADGIPMDLREAVKYFQRAAKEREPVSQCMLAMLERWDERGREGVSPGAEQNFD